jgi:hypothetical protein
MSLLTVCQSAVKASGFAVPSTIIGNSDNTAAMLLALVNKAGKQRAKYPWQALQMEYTFNLVNGTASYAFPSDLGFFENETFWDRTQYWNLRGSLSPQDWQIYKSGIQSTTPRQRFRIWKGLIYIDPTPTTTDTVVIEYVSSKWVTDGGSFFTSYTSDTQTAVIDEDLLELDLTWRFLERKGLAYAEARDEADHFCEKLLARDTPKQTINMGAPSSVVWPPLPTVPITGFS